MIPDSARLTDIFPQFRKWEDLSAQDQAFFTTNMAVMAGMLEAMDDHIGKYIDYLTKEGLMDNTVFIITSDNGPDGGDYRAGLPWALRNGYHRDIEKKGAEGYFGYLGPEFAHALASPFSYFKYYTGEGGLRVPLIIHGKTLPKSRRTDAFCFFTDIAPTIYDIVGLSTKANEGYAPITGKSMLPHILDITQPVYQPHEGVGLEAASSSAYFLNGYKIVKNNIPLGDNQWHMYNLVEDPVESTDIANQEPALFQKMLAEYNAYEKRVGVVKMPEGYSAAGTVAKKSYRMIFLNWLPYLLLLLAGLTGWIVWNRRRKKQKGNNPS